MSDYPQDFEALSTVVSEPDLQFLAQECIANQLGVNLNTVELSDCRVSVFHSAIATFFAPSDPSGTHGMRRERIRSTPSWRGRKPQRNCAFVVEDADVPGMAGLNVVQVQLFFSLVYHNVLYPMALVDWFKKGGCDPLTEMWVVHPDVSHRSQDRTVLHLDSFLRGAHLIPIFGNNELPLDLHFTDSLNAFEQYYVNKYIDHHAHKIIF